MHLPSGSPSVRRTPALRRRALPLFTALLGTLALGSAVALAAPDEKSSSDTRISAVEVHGPGNDSAASTDESAATIVKSTKGTTFRVAGTDGDGLRVRKAPGLESTVVGALPEGSELTLRDGVAREADGERWLPVKTDEGKGWVAARYLRRAVALKPIVRSPGKDASLSERVTALAEAQLGKPYVWGGAGPSGFDCSGFVQWVFGQAGVKLPRSIPEQLEQGKKVDRGELQEGDLLAFSDTYMPGLSHVGIYVGKGRFVHAADEAYGVTVSDLYDEYWEPRFYRAVRLR